MSLEARSSEDSFERLRFLVRSLSFLLEKSCGGEERVKSTAETVLSLLSADKTEAWSSSKLGNSNSGKLSKTGTGISLLCGIGLDADLRFG